MLIKPQGQRIRAMILPKVPLSKNVSQSATPAPSPPVSQPTTIPAQPNFQSNQPAPTFTQSSQPVTYTTAPTNFSVTHTPAPQPQSSPFMQSTTTYGQPQPVFSQPGQPTSFAPATQAAFAQPTQNLAFTQPTTTSFTAPPTGPGTAPAQTNLVGAAPPQSLSSSNQYLTD